jgi:predicted transcriptional regulator
MKDVITIRLAPEVIAKLDRLARATARTKSFLVADAIQEYLKVNEWQVEAIEEGVRQADEGRLITNDEVRKKWEDKLARPLD